jgi:hypothetical protein
MLTGTQDHTIDCILVQFQQACGSSNTNSFGRMVDNLPDRLGRQVKTKKGAGLCGSKAFAAGAAVKQISALVLAILAANRDVALMSQPKVLTFFVGAETLIKLSHRLPPHSK